MPMKQHWLSVIDNRALCPALRLLSLSAPNLTAAPGQFLHVLCRDPEAYTPFLRRAIPIHRLGSDRIDLLVRPDQRPGLSWLARRQPGDALDALGPLGRGFALPDAPGHLLLLAHGHSVAPLVGLADRAVDQGWAVTLLATVARPADVYPAALLSPAVEYQAVPGDNGPLAPLSTEALAWADLLVAAIPSTAWADLRQRIETVRVILSSGFAQVWADMPLACGVGHCGACALETRQGWQRICTNGPAFDLTEVTGP